MLRRTIAFLLAVLFVATACGEAQQDIKDVRRAIARTERSSYELRYTEETEAQKVEVTFELDDSFRSRSTLTIDGLPVLQETLVDDAVALRLLEPDRWNPAANTPLESMLGSGRWVVDPAGAPPVLFADAGSGSSGDVTDTGIDHLADAANAFAYVSAAVESSSQVARFDPDSIQYRPSEDPFNRFVERDDELGLIRYDAVPPLLPRSREQNQGTDEPPDTRFFRRLAVYVDKDKQAVRVLEVINFERHPEILKAKRERKPRFLLTLLQGLRRGVGEDPIRPRAMSMYIERKPDLEITVPGDAITANLGSLLESEALLKLPRFESESERTESA